MKLIIGPQSSSELAAIMDAANQRGVLVVSQGSTASSLGIPNDMIFRFVVRSGARNERGRPSRVVRPEGVEPPTLRFEA